MTPLPTGLVPHLPLTALAPMQRVTDLPFMAVIASYGAPDYFFTEYFRVHCTSRLDKEILRSISDNRTGRPVFAQLMGEAPAELARAARELARYPIAGVDLNMGCPAPMIYKGNVGGGLLRDPARIDQILGALRDAIPGLFTVKMRIGFDSTDNFETILALLDKHSVDLLSLHARTVRENYFGNVHYDRIADAVRFLKVPVLANGNITSAAKAVQVLRETGAAGVMLGRHAIRNPWVFRHYRELSQGQPLTLVTLEDVRGYIQRLYDATRVPGLAEPLLVSQAKRYLNFIGTSVDRKGAFLFEMRRAQSEAELFRICDKHLLSDPTAPYPLEPYSDLVARPSCESPRATEA